MSTLPKLIGFSGFKGSGKDTAAAVLIERFGYDRRAFAGPLKNMLRTLLKCQGVDADHIERMIEGDLKELPSPYLGGRSPRHAMQTLGTQWGRELIGSAYWVEAWTRSLTTTPRVVVTDVRFINEAETLERLGGSLIHIDRTGRIPNDNHESEQHLSNLRQRASLVVLNDAPTSGDFQDYFCKVLQTWELDAA